MMDHISLTFKNITIAYTYMNIHAVIASFFSVIAMPAAQSPEKNLPEIVFKIHLTMKLLDFLKET